MRTPLDDHDDSARGADSPRGLVLHIAVPHDSTGKGLDRQAKRGKKRTRGRKRRTSR